MVESIQIIVEGHGEVQAAPILVRRFLERFMRFDVTVGRPFRVPRGRLLQNEHLQRAVSFVARKSDVSLGVLVLVDADDDAPCVLGPQLLAAVTQAVPALVTSVVVATREYEAWFLASAVSLRTHHRVRRDATSPPRPESIRDAKGYLQQHILRPNLYYSETVDQPSLTAHMDFDQARDASSFNKLYRDMERLLVVA
jgi:hypothetical protein